VPTSPSQLLTDMAANKAAATQNQNAGNTHF